MERKLLVLAAALLSFFYAPAQTYTGKLGYGISPEGFPYDYSQIGVFQQEVAGMCGDSGGVVYMNGNWYDDTSSCGQIPGGHGYTSLSQPNPYGYTDMLTFAFAHYPTLFLAVPNDPTNNWTNATMRGLFLQTLIRAADSLQPAYLFIGNEVDFYLEQDSADYSNFVGFYHAAYDSVKAHSPATKVGTVFNFEHLSGSGTLNAWITPHWSAMDMIDTAKLDILGLSVYPFFSYSTANAVPLTYLDSVFDRLGNKPLAITETGWPGDSLFGSWNASPQQQVDYVNRLFPMISGRNVEVVNWLFLNYLQDTTNDADKLIFKSIAMRDSLGNDRPALALWQTMCGPNGMAAAEENVSVSVFPNPSQGRVQLKFSQQKNAALEIFDAQGRKVFQQTALRSGDEIDTGLAPGLYIYRITLPGNAIVQDKLLVVRPD